MAEKTTRQRRRAIKWYFWFSVAAVVVATMLYFYYQYPYKEIGPQQPIYFSHRVHAGVKQIDCKFCHPYGDRSTQPGIPTVEKCFYCHTYVIPQHPQIVQERRHYDTRTPVPWVRVFYVPDHVQFTHMPHIKWAKLDCTECHGNVKTMDRLQHVSFKMGFCIECHKERKAQIDCWLACHH